MKALSVIFWPVLAPALLFGIAMGATTPVLILAALQLGASQSYAAIIVAAMGALSLTTMIPVGMFVDRIGDARAMTAAAGGIVVVTALTVGALAWGGGPAALALYTASLILRAPVEDVFRLARQAFTAVVTPPQHIGKAMTALGGTMRVGNLIGPLASSLLLLVLPMWSVFVFSAVMAVLAVLCLRMPQARVFEEKVRVTPETEHPKLRQLDVRWKAVALVGVSITMLTVCRAVMPIVVQLWGGQLGLAASTISLIIAAGAAVELLIMVPAALIKDGFGRATTTVSCLAVFAAGYFVMVTEQSVAYLVAAVLVMAIGNGLGAGINMTIGADLSPKVGRARFLGVWALFPTAGLLGGPSVISALIAVVSLQAGIVAAGGLGLFGALWMLVWARTIGLPRHLR